MGESNAYYVVYGPEKAKVSAPDCKWEYLMVKWLITKDGTIYPTSIGKGFETLTEAQDYLRGQGHIPCETRKIKDPAIVETWI